MMKGLLRYSCLLVALTAMLVSCISSKKAATVPETRYLLENAGEIEALVKYCLLFGIDNRVTYFEIDSLANNSTKRKLSSYGSSVQITYDDKYTSSTDFDSTVIFKRITLLHGVREVIFDFAEQTKEREVYFTSRRDPYLIRVTDRIYYRKRPFPMM
jgi:hypothetical protein